MRQLTLLASLCLVILFQGAAFAQEPLYKISINVVERSTKAINYRHRGGATAIDFKGTPLLPASRGEAKVESKQGYMEIEVEFDKLEPATRFGPEYLTYVMWAITPEGRAQNLGEVILNGASSKLNVTTELQAFGLIVTAEPYFAVTQPSDVVVMENIVREDTKGAVEQVDANYQLLKRGTYTTNVAPAELTPIKLDPKVPLDLYEARNALRIAGWSKAPEDARESYEKAETLLRRAEDYLARKQNDKSISMAAREAAQAAEDSRLIALKNQEDARLAAERRAAADRESQARAAEAQAKAAAEAESQRRAAAELEQKAEAERRARAELERRASEAEARAAAEVAARERAEADRARQDADKAEREQRELRAMLAEQLNRVLETKETPRGLVVNMSDVLFDTGSYNLKPAAREKLAKVGGIILAHPGLSIEVEGHTDSTGSDETNQKLSEQRAGTVRDYLVQQGLNPASITARGMGEGYPVASNDTTSGRQQNRRVEMIVAGDIIGTPVRISTAN